MKRALALAAVVVAVALALSGCARHGRLGQTAGNTGVGTVATVPSPAGGPGTAPAGTAGNPAVDNDLSTIDKELSTVDSQLAQATQAADADN